MHLLHKRLTPDEQIEMQLEEISQRSAVLQEEARKLESELGVNTP